MNWNIYQDGSLINTISADEAFVKQYCSENGYTYERRIDPVYETISAAKQREELYNTDPVIIWEDEQITVTQASQKWQYYAAEGSEKAAELQKLIAEAKAAIREKCK